MPKEITLIHNVIQVFPQKNFTVYVYFADGKIKLFDMKPLLGKGVFKKISDTDSFINKCTVIKSYPCLR
jgi:hypothetical protein